MSALRPGASTTKLWVTQKDIETLRRGLFCSADHTLDPNIEKLIARLASAESRLREAGEG